LEEQLEGLRRCNTFWKGIEAHEEVRRKTTLHAHTREVVEIDTRRDVQKPGGQEIGDKS
jgi:hypothetical protein